MFILFFHLFTEICSSKSNAHHLHSHSDKITAKAAKTIRKKFEQNEYIKIMGEYEEKSQRPIGLWPIVV